MNLTTYFLRFFIFGQVIFFWLFFNLKSIDFDTKIFDSMFYTYMILLAFIIRISNFSFDLYLPHLLIQYCFFVIVGFKIFRKKYSFNKSVSLAFLIVFLNSYYWETVLHFSEFIVKPSTLFNIRELFHLAVIPFLLSHFDFDKHYTLKQLRKGIIISFILSVIVIEGIQYHRIPIVFLHSNFLLKAVIWFMNRFICLLILVDVVYNAKIKKQS